MARKSRKTVAQAENHIASAADSGYGIEAANSPQGAIGTEDAPQSLCQTALYARLSTLDNGNKNSDSLKNQIALLEAYAKTHPALGAYKIYADNGESGTNFERAAFLQMLSDIRAGSIRCVIVKDLSRFGRNHIEAGNYIERIFPFLGVRFIAINDQYDSAAVKKGDSPLVVPLKNLVNEMYARDISLKVTAQFTVKQKSGEFLGSFAPYGYLRAPEERHKLIPDVETAPIVQQIFGWKLGGLGDARIAKQLTDAGVPPPGRYRYEKGIVTDEKYKAARIWHKSAIRRILHNPVYLGQMAQARQYTSIFMPGARRQRPPEEWIVVQGTHEALIDEATFLQVQTLHQNRKAKG